MIRVRVRPTMSTANICNYENYELRAEDIPHLLVCLTNVSHKWEELGIALELPKHVIEQCRNRQNVVALNEILNEWIQRSKRGKATLGVLKKRVGGGIVAHGRLAQELVQRFATLKGAMTHSSNGSSNGVNGTDENSKLSILQYLMV